MDNHFFRSVYVITLAIILVFVVPAHCQDFGKISDAEWQAGAPADYPEAGAVILFDRAEVFVKREIIEIDRHMRIKVLTPAGIEEVGDLSFMYDKEFDKLKGFEAHTITPDGKKHKVEKNAIFEKTVGAYEEKTFSFPVVKEGVIVEFKYHIRSKNYRYLKPWYFQNRIYTLRSSFSVSLSTGFSYNIQYSHVPPQDRNPVETQSLDPEREFGTVRYIKTFTWERKNMPPIRNEPYMSSINDYRSALHFQIYSYEDQYNYLIFVENWDKLGEEFENRILDDYRNKGGDIKQLAREVTAGAATPQEKSKALYEYAKATYEVSEEYERGYFIQDKISKLLEHKYGSAEEINFLLAELHRAVDIPAWPVLISTREHGRVDPNSPDLRQFDYMITFVQFGDKWEFLDTSNRLLPYGLLPPQCLTDVGFLIDGKESSLVKISIKDIESGRLDKTRIFIGDDGVAVCSTECCFTGYYASEYASNYEGKKPDEFIDEYYIDRLKINCDIGNYCCEKDSLERFLVRLDYSTDDMVDRLDNNFLIKPVSYAYRNNPFKSEKRFFPVDFSYPFVYRNEVDIYYRDTVEQCLLPDDIVIAIEGASFERQSRMSDSCVTVISTLTVQNPQIPPQQYGELRRLFERIAQATEDEVTAIMASSP